MCGAISSYSRRKTWPKTRPSSGARNTVSPRLLQTDRRYTRHVFQSFWLYFPVAISFYFIFVREKKPIVSFIGWQLLLPFRAVVLYEHCMEAYLKTCHAIV